jgi:hypothetical protein
MHKDGNEPVPFHSKGRASISRWCKPRYGPSQLLSPDHEADNGRLVSLGLRAASQASHLLLHVWTGIEQIKTTNHMCMHLLKRLIARSCQFAFFESNRITSARRKLRRPLPSREG